MRRSNPNAAPRRTLATCAVVVVCVWCWLTPFCGLTSVGATTESDEPPEHRGEPPWPPPPHPPPPVHHHSVQNSPASTGTRHSEGGTHSNDIPNDNPGMVVQSKGNGDSISSELPELAEQRLTNQQEQNYAAVREAVSNLNARLHTIDDNEIEGDVQQGSSSETRFTKAATDQKSDSAPSSMATQPAIPPPSEHDWRRATLDDVEATLPAPLQTTNDQLHAAAEVIKETIRSEQTASPLPLLDHPPTRERSPTKENTMKVHDSSLTPNSGDNDDNQDDDDDGVNSSEDPVGVRLDDGFESEVVENEESFALPHDDEIDDRTLLDIFGESAKEYLTQRVIPETDTDCLWDWRSLRCEPSCQCTFEFKSGDYHLGRSCRKRLEEEICKPTVFIQDKPIPKRILSLIRQTADIVGDSVKLTAHNVVQTTTSQYLHLQEHICLDLRSRLHRNPATGLPCWSSVPETTTLLEKLLCGQIEGPLCEDVSRQTTNAPIVAATTERGRRSNTIFGDFYEKEI